MKRSRVFWVGVVVVACSGLMMSCSKETPQPQTQQTTSPPNPPAQASTQPAPQASQTAQPEGASAATQSEAASSPLAGPGGPAATEKHSMKLTNYAGTAVTVTLNGEWIGQWDSHAESPLDKVVQGKNQLVVELQDEPKNAVTLEVYAQRAGNWVNLLRLNFQGKAKGSYTYTFVAR